MLGVVVALSLAAWPLSPQGPILEQDAGIKQFGGQYYPPESRLIVGDTLVYTEANQFFSCLRNNQPLQLAFTSAGGVPFRLAMNVHPSGTNWLVASYNRALRVLRVDCATSPQPVDLPGTTNYFVPFEGLSLATVDRDGQVIAATNERLIRFDPITGSPVVLHTIAALEQQLLTADERANLTPHKLVPTDLLATPHGDTWIILEWTAPTQVDILFLVRRDAAGVITQVLREQLGAIDPPSVFRPKGNSVGGRKAMFYEPSRDLIVLQGELNYPSAAPLGVWRPSLVAFPATGPVQFARVALDLVPWLVQSTGEGLWVHTGSPEGFGPIGTQFMVVLDYGPLRFDGATDLDGDDLSFATEQTLGTDDLRLDSDGDAVWDHLELTRFGTDPADAGSAPPRPDVPITGFAFSSRLQEWPEFANAGLRFGGIAPDLAPGRAYCRGVESTTCTVRCTGFEFYDCFGADGARVHTEPLKRFPSFGPGASEWWVGDEMGLEFGNAAGSRRVALAGECNADRCGVVMPVAPGLAYGPGPVISSVGLDLRRFTPEGSSSVCVPEGCAPRLIGQDESRGEAFVAKTVGHRERIYAVAPDGGASFIFDSAFFRSHTVDALWTDPQTLISSLTVGGARESLVLDEGFVPVSTSSTAFAAAEPFFRIGFGLKLTHAFMHAPYTGGSGGGGCPLGAPPEVCSPPPLAKRLPWPAFTELHGELVPVDARARPGDVLFWVHSLQDASSGYAIEARALGGLWLHRESGATDQWASPAQLLHVSDAAAAASLAMTPFGPARQVSVAPSGVALCFTDFTGRLFTVALTDGRPSALALVQAANAHGCAYTDDGTLAVLEKDSVVVGALRFSAATAGDTTGESLHRAGTGWIARMTQGSPESARVEARCFDAAGAQTGEVLHVSALTVEDGLVYWLERLDTLSGATSLPSKQQGRAFAATVEDFCAGRFSETLAAKEDRQLENLWADLFEGVIARDEPFQVLHGTLVRRPDGLMLLSSRGVDSKERGGVDARGKFLFEFPFRFLPAFHPVNGELPRHAPWRRKASSFSLVHPWPAFVTAMATVPGEVPASWGEVGRTECLGRPCTPYVVGPAPVDADAGTVEMADAGVAMTPPTTTGCGCNTGAPPMSLLVLAVALVRRRTARRRPARA